MIAHVTAWWSSLEDETRATLTWGPFCAVVLPFDVIALMLLGGR